MSYTFLDTSDTPYRVLDGTSFRDHHYLRIYAKNYNCYYKDAQFIHVCCTHNRSIFDNLIDRRYLYRDSTYDSDREEKNNPFLYAPLSMWFNFNNDFFLAKKQSRYTPFFLSTFTLI